MPGDQPQFASLAFSLACLVLIARGSKPLQFDAALEVIVDGPHPFLE
jgi:hypothetical protein